MARKTISSLKGFPIICTPIGEPIDALVDCKNLKTIKSDSTDSKVVQVQVQWS